jgi:hypothetical protein
VAGRLGAQHDYFYYFPGESSVSSSSTTGLGPGGRLEGLSWSTCCLVLAASFSSRVVGTASPPTSLSRSSRPACSRCSNGWNECLGRDTGSSRRGRRDGQSGEKIKPMKRKKESRRQERKGMGGDTNIITQEAEEDERKKET